MPNPIGFEFETVDRALIEASQTQFNPLQRDLCLQASDQLRYQAMMAKTGPLFAYRQQLFAEPLRDRDILAQHFRSHGRIGDQKYFYLDLLTEASAYLTEEVLRRLVPEGDPFRVGDIMESKKWHESSPWYGYANPNLDSKFFGARIFLEGRFPESSSQYWHLSLILMRGVLLDALEKPLVLTRAMQAEIA